MTDHLTIRGFVATVPDLRTLPDGTPVCSFRVASTARWFDGRTGDWAEGHTNWFTVNSFRTLATNIAASIKVGHPVLVRGKLKVRHWTTAQYEKRTSVDIEAQSVGPDLAFGTATYARNSGKRGTRTEIKSPGSADPENSWEAAAEKHGLSANANPKSAPPSDPLVEAQESLEDIGLAGESDLSGLVCEGAGVEDSKESASSDQ
ncbi:single-stranded DNA-binding protein [Rothia sp. HC945]|uniref:single-stranded DNA-binding protein n=1 Tax=Rothia sp. HC945 TaxID=3171170 RepID=UPI00264B1A1A|nr:single-stranded DNA-binding protein [Kocuria sp.]MDN5618206.1 single-stranded DNA-binding protein [Kocuria sp.]